MVLLLNLMLFFSFRERFCLFDSSPKETNMCKINKNFFWSKISPSTVPMVSIQTIFNIEIMLELGMKQNLNFFVGEIFYRNFIMSPDSGRVNAGIRDIQALILPSGGILNIQLFHAQFTMRHFSSDYPVNCCQIFSSTETGVRQSGLKVAGIMPA